MEFRWRTAVKCEDCPFASSGPGLDLRRSLGRARWRYFLRGLRNERHFWCHKTSRDTGNGTNLVCAGSIEWSDKHGVSQNVVRVMERIDVMLGRGKVK